MYFSFHSLALFFSVLGDFHGDKWNVWCCTSVTSVKIDLNIGFEYTHIVNYTQQYQDQTYCMYYTNVMLFFWYICIWQYAAADSASGLPAVALLISVGSCKINKICDCQCTYIYLYIPVSYMTVCTEWARNILERVVHSGLSFEVVVVFTRVLKLLCTNIYKLIQNMAMLLHSDKHLNIAQ